MQHSKKSTYRLLSLGVALAVFLLTSAFRMPQKPGKEGRKEARTYLKENVLPVVAQQRQKLDTYLSVDEKRQVNEIREQLRSLRQQGRDMRQEHRKGEKPTEAQKEQHREMRKSHRRLMTKAWKIVDNNEEPLESLLGEMKDDAQQWKADLKAIHEKYRAQHQGNNTERTDKRHRRGRKHGQRRARAGMAGRQHRSMKHFQMLRPVHFLLFNTERWEEMLPGEESGRVIVFPNPTEKSMNMEFELEQAGNIKIVLFDQNGKTVRNLYEGQQSAGMQQFSFDVSALKTGVYYFELTTPEDTKKGRFFKK